MRKVCYDPDFSEAFLKHCRSESPYPPTAEQARLVALSVELCWIACSCSVSLIRLDIK